MQQAPKQRRGAGPAGDPDTEEDDDDVVVGVIEQDRPAATRKPPRSPPPDDVPEVPDGARSWMDLHGPSLYVIGCLAVLGGLMVLQAAC